MTASLTIPVTAPADDRRAAILHADLDSFYASVEQRDNPELRGKPIAVGGGVVLAASYEAKARGVRTAMGGRQARQLCPDLIVVDAHFDAYVEASRKVFEIFRDTTPLVEGISIDEAFLDVRGLRKVSGEPVVIAQRLRRRVADEVGLPITVGIARTKFLAKVASAVAKPDGLLLVPPDGELAFLHPLPVERMWGVGAVTAAKLHGNGLRTVGDMATVGEAGLVSILGPFAGHHLFALAMSRDSRQVHVGRRRRSVGAQRALGRSRLSADGIDEVAVGLVDRVSRRMRHGNRAGRTVVLRLRFDDFSRISRSRTLPEATDSTDDILTAVRALLAGAAPLIATRGLTLVGIAVSNLDGDGAVQLELPFDGVPGIGLDTVLDSVRDKFGLTSLTRAVHLGKDEGIVMPVLPDGA